MRKHFEDCINPLVLPAEAVSANREKLAVKALSDDSGYHFTLENHSGSVRRIREVRIMSGLFPVSGATPFYGEGFQMLAQYSGVLSSPRSIGRCPDHGEYNIPRSAEGFTVYSLLLLSPAADSHCLIAFTSCRRFSGQFRLLSGNRFEAVLDTEGLALAPGERWDLEDLAILEGGSPDELFEQLAVLTARNHPPLSTPSVPSGWCSWYHYYAGVGAADILENARAIREHSLPLEYLLIDDGYQERMGDWLVPSRRFPGGVPDLLKDIREQGLKPALWVAPFIAEPESRIFREHPDWFVQDGEGRPLAAEEVTYGGWRSTPWYVLDGTHPAVQSHLRTVFRTMRQEWGCTYFKLDALFWGSIHGGVHYDRKATRIEAYRQGMQAILEGADDAFLLGCNAPIWPSLGLVHGMRVSDDIARSDDWFRHVARETFHRLWQHGRLWLIDPDCIVLQDIEDQQATPAGYSFHRAAILASGGLLFSGDRLDGMSEDNLAVLSRLGRHLPGRIRFTDQSFAVGSIDLPGRIILCIFNWEDHSLDLDIPLSGPFRFQEYWSGRDMGTIQDAFRVRALPPDAAMVVEGVREG